MENGMQNVESQITPPCNLFDKSQQDMLKDVLIYNQSRCLPFSQFMVGHLIGEDAHKYRDLVSDYVKNSLNSWLHKNIDLEYIQCEYQGKQTRDKWESYAFCFTFKVKKKNPVRFDYFMGIGHAFDNKALKKIDISKIRLQQLESPCYKIHKVGEVYKNQETFYKYIVNPSLYDLFYSLIMESDALESNFLDWCDYSGYDNDSIKALNTYNACVENGRKLRNLVGYKGIEFLKDYLQDY